MFVRTSKGPPTATVDAHHIRLLPRRFPTGSTSKLCLSLLFVIHLLFSHTNAALLQGCTFDEDLCDKSAGEICISDGLFGQCYSAAESDALTPLVLQDPLNELQSELLRLELTRLANNGFDWPDAQAQCTLAYFKLSIAYQLDYDTEFCSVRNPSNIWELIQRVQGALSSEDVNAGDNDETPDDANAVPVVLLEQDEQEGGGLQPRQEELYQIVSSPDEENVVLAEPVPELNIPEADYQEQVEDAGTDDAETLSQSQLLKLIGFMDALQASQAADELASAPEVEEFVPLDSPDDGQQVLKKDAENFNNADMGLANTVHKIVKGGIQRVEGNRVYLKVEPKANMTEEELYKLIVYLDKKIAAPNNLYFDEFLYENEQLSFRISRLDPLPEATNKKVDKKAHVESASGVAEAVYKRRKDIQTMAGVRVDETGIGSGEDVVPVERSGGDMFFYPILAICALTITNLISVLAVHAYRNKRRGHTYNKSFLPEVIDHLEGKASSIYEELCRQRKSTQDVPASVKVVGSKHSSTSSWPDESLLQSSNLDISTGHVLLEFLQECMDKPEEMANQWASLQQYTNKDATTSVASEEQNAEKNCTADVLPYDESLVPLQGGYINASKIYDSDPRQVAYIAAQAPMENTAVDFWQMIWDQGVALVVNLMDQEDLKEGKFIQYWPEEGAKSFGQFEIHLVSEHIWNENYVVRSLYLKNLSTNETRTVTQFHYLTWPQGGIPASTKSLLEFRRKVNKSYRGRASPIIVHCTNGAGRTGAYCLLDMIGNRLLKGVKEMNIAASLEHLRDQRMRMVENEEQYKLVHQCVAEEVSSLLKNLQH